MGEESRLEGHDADLDSGHLAFHPIPKDRVHGHAADLQSSLLVIGTGRAGKRGVRMLIDPPPQVAAAGHNRCIIAIKPERLDEWLHPDAKRLGEQLSILGDPIDVYYEHELVEPIR